VMLLEARRWISPIDIVWVEAIFGLGGRGIGLLERVLDSEPIFGFSILRGTSFLGINFGCGVCCALIEIGAR
jgi:hypothetical protein